MMLIIDKNNKIMSIGKKDTPQFELLFCTVLYQSTSPSGQRYLFQKTESTEMVRAERE